MSKQSDQVDESLRRQSGDATIIMSGCLQISCYGDSIVGISGCTYPEGICFEVIRFINPTLLKLAIN